MSDVVTQMITEDQTLFEVVGTDINGCKSTARRVVKMQNAPVLTVTGDTVICEGDKVSLNVAGVGAKTFEWGNGAIGNKFIDKPRHDTIYFVSGTSLYGCTSSKMIPVIVNPLPSISIYGNNEICQGDTTTLTVLGAKSYVWSSGDKTDTISIKPRKNAVYQVTGTDENGCSAMEQINIQVYDMPELHVQTSAGIVCEGDSVRLIARVNNGEFDQFYWSSKNGIMGNTYGDTITAYLMKTDTFYVTAKNDVCTNRAMATVATFPNPTLSYIGDSSVCQGSRLQMIAQGASTYEWVLPDSTVVPNSILAFVPTEPTILPIKLIGHSNSYKTEKIFDVEVKPSPVMSVSITGGEGSTATDGYVCRGSDYTVIASGADSYVWNTGETTREISGTNLVTPMAYTVTGSNIYNCQTQVAVTVPLKMLPKVKINVSKDAVCPNQGDTIHFAASGAESYYWTSYPAIADINNNPDLTEIDAAVWDSGWVYVSGIDTNMCVGMDSIKIKVHTLDSVKYVINPQLIDEKYNTVSLSGRTPSSEIHNVEWTWEISDGTMLNGKAVKHTFDVLEDSFLVTVHATDWNGCKYEDDSYIYKWQNVWAPDKFTPDGNGLNDKFQFEGSKFISEFDFIIYNRLGEVVFEGHSLRDAWDGTFKGKPCAPGVYGWTCTYKSTVGSYTNSDEEKGKVTLIR
ncbi:MAG: gliding motility-associated C-terminal domain-containing protein [Bacteroidales bacterium]|nr:gliding motility-associated C-terminal domain-containing protein [Candidatus Scybalocola fimicaballi]